MLSGIVSVNMRSVVILSTKASVILFSVMMRGVMSDSADGCYAECHGAECHVPECRGAQNLALKSEENQYSIRIQKFDCFVTFSSLQQQ